ncbi:hypothetical protein GCM10020358_59510 [Amorphoplanes nipponensis]|uniref:Hint domain-containing protein n=1 Tax=Actinoplanes nipponensis TaxID=135950 RepID=A0A919JHK5_9ACTN|nr:polymorphic toxin-type HINT domain-containing protein [Actinoplanes nipponensis]GIE46929.1 hypothetical protein Ani05nite_04630 [Actinoplanes nipponensis]
MNGRTGAKPTADQPRLIGGRRRRLAATLAAALVVTLAAELPAGPAAAAPWQPPPAPRPTEVAGVPRHSAEPPPGRPSWTAGAREVLKAPPVTWPAGGRAIANLAASKAATGARQADAGNGPAARPQPVRVGNLPVWVSGVPQTAAKAAGGATPVDAVSVAIRDRAATKRAGVAGLVLDLHRSDGAPTAGATSVTVDYSGFAQAYGGDWASRLRLVNLANGKPVAGTNDTKTSTVSAVVPLAANGAVTTLAVSAGASGDNGTYSATSLSQAGTWGVSQQNGGFSWSQPLRTPPGVGGPAPSLSLSYSSASVDGRTAGTNTQGSWIGDGWDLWPGSIERTFVGCQEDKDAVDAVKPNNASLDVGDLCWYKPEGNATMSFNGQATELVKSSGNQWKGVADDGSKIELLTDTTLGNGDDNGEYWKVTTLDGTQYYFGRNKVPGGASGTEVTNSTWTVPVYGNHPKEPGYVADKFADSGKTQAWRWNLDYVVDPHGNAMSYYYGTEQGAYGREGSKDKRTTYDRGGYLSRIDYGNRIDAATTVQAAARVLFTTDNRCASSCYNGTDPVPASWVDTPWDQYCKAAPCTDQLAPTFWTTKRLAGIRTQVYSGTGTTYTDVESWTLRHTYLQAGGNEGKPMWLAGITHTGKVTGAGGGAETTDPEIVFDAGNEPLANRVDGPADGRSSLFRSRIKTITTESGAQIGVTYSGTECTRSTLPAPHSNGKRCFPQWYAPSGEDPKLDWFHHYRVARVDVYDQTGGFTHEQSNYDYLDAPAWHYDDSELVKVKYRTWGQFRGYGKVRVRTGLESGVQSATEYLYLRGMDGDKQPDKDGKLTLTRDEWVTDSQNTKIEDHEAYAGMLYEQTTLLGAGGAWNSGLISTPVKQGPTASSGPLKAWMVNTGTLRARTKLSNGGTRWSKTAFSYNSDNLPTTADDLGDESTTADDRCTRTWYARNADRWMLNLTKRSETVGVACTTTAVLPRDMHASTRITYDNAANNWDTDLPVKGDAVKTEQISSWNGATPVWSTANRATFDPNGRVLDLFDALGRKTGTKYVPASAGPVTATTGTDALGRTTTTTLHPAWGVPTKVADPNSQSTEMTYDASGRLLGVWLPGRPKATNPTAPNASYAYQLRNKLPSSVTTKTLLPNGSNTYATGITLYDGQLRPRQTQTQAPGGGRTITDTVYDSRGLLDWTSSPYYDTTNATPTADKFAGGPGDPPPPATTVNTYDGAARITTSTFMVGTVAKWNTTYAYAGERTDITPPDGGTATSSIVDGRGQQTEVRQYKKRSDLGSADPNSYDKSQYAYTSRGQLASFTDAAGNTWRYTYDQLSRKTSDSDPDKGTTTYTYDAAGQLLTTTDARQQTLAYTYDDLGRRLTSRDTTIDGPKRAEWVYDQLPNGIGKLNKSIRYLNGQQYVNEVTEFDTAGRATKNQTTIPAAEGGLCAAAGTTPCTYASSVTYRASGHTATATLPQAADLPSERFLYGYNDVGAAAGIVTAGQIYVQQVTYNKLGQLTQRVLGEQPKRIWQSYIYDQHTSRLSDASAIAELATQDISKFHYDYDAIGNITAITDKPANGTADTQCYAYDYLRRLTEAWTPTNPDCKTAPTTVSAMGGPAPYWHSYQYTDKPGLTGSRTKEIRHTASGDTTRDYTYPTQGGGAGSKPHALQTVTTTNPAGATTKTETYDYDAAGNTTCRPAGAAGNNCALGTDTNNQKLTWDVEGHLATAVIDGVTTSYVYDADGNRIIRRDATGSTLYLPDGTEVRQTTSGAVTATRYYNHVGTTIGVRTAAGLKWMVNDHHQTSEATVDAGTLATTRRRTLPFGEERGTTNGVWPPFIDKGFLGGTKDPAGLTHLGAREYDPTTGRFISVDPVLTLDDAQQWHGYAYSHNNPASFSDPTGLADCDYAWGCNVGGGSQYDDFPGKDKGDDTSGGGKPGGGRKDSDKPTSTSTSSSSNAAEHRAVTKKKPPKFAKFAVDFIDGCGVGYLTIGACHITDLTEAEKNQAWIAYACEYLGDCTASLAADQANRDAYYNYMSMVPYVGIPYSVVLIKKAVERGDYTTAAIETVGIVPLGKATKLLKVGKACSFGENTPVLMADGTTKPMKELEVGDVVLATDPESGREGPRVVTEVWVHQDALFDLTVAGETIATTEDHPFWNATDHEWQRADALDYGDLLLGPKSSTSPVGSLSKESRIDDAYNLTVADIHTYYVLAGNTPVLVHNTGPCSVSMDTALDQAAKHVGDNPTVVRSGSGGVQFMSVTVDSAGNTVRKIARFDVNPNSAHVQQWGPHLNLETQVNGRTVTTGPLRDPHTPIDPATIRNGDWWD